MYMCPTNYQRTELRYGTRYCTVFSRLARLAVSISLSRAKKRHSHTHTHTHTQQSISIASLPSLRFYIHAIRLAQPGHRSPCDCFRLQTAPPEASLETMLCCAGGDGDAAVSPGKLRECPVNHHLRLGITLKAMVAFMKRIGWDPNDGPGSTYKRDETRLGWVTQLCGAYDPEISPLSGEKHHLTGYDFQDAIRTWLRKRGCAHLSVLEVLRKESNPGVGKATAFYSHALEPSFLGWNGTVARISQACSTFKTSLPEDSTFFFLDLFSLRQCELEKNWNVSIMMGAIHACQCVVAEVDHGLVALSRSFVLFEMHCGLSVRMPVLINTFLVETEMRAMLHDKPVDWEAAESPHEKMKKDMRMEVHDAGGAKLLNERVEQACRNGARSSYTIYGSPKAGPAKKRGKSAYQVADGAGVEPEDSTMGKTSTRHAW